MMISLMLIQILVENSVSNVLSDFLIMKKELITSH